MWTVQNGTLQVAAASLGQDAAAVFYLDEYMPIYFEIAAQIMANKPTAGWKANAYVIFDYFSPTDFKFAGHRRLDQQARDGLPRRERLARRRAGARAGSRQGRHLVRHARRDQRHDDRRARSNGQQAFTHTFAPRMLDGEPVGLNKGFVGAGSDNSRGSWDNFVVQVLPPQLTLDSQTSFTGGAGAFTGRADRDVDAERRPLRVDGVVG